MLAIAYTGIGIAKDALTKLGRPFEQVESQLTKTYLYHGKGPQSTVELQFRRCQCQAVSMMLPRAECRGFHPSVRSALSLEARSITCFCWLRISMDVALRASSRERTSTK